MSENPVLSLRDVSIAFDGREPVVKGVSCDVWAGATTCIVGESGSGKTLTSLAVMGLLPGSGKLEGGEVREGALGEAGADLVQIYTGFIYRGPSLVGECARALT